MADNKQPASYTTVGTGYFGPALYRKEDISFLSKKLFELYDKDNSSTMGPPEVANMIIDLYKSMNKSVTPSMSDVEGFSKRMDLNRDGIVTPSDMEACIRRYMGVDMEIVRTTVTSTTTTSVHK